MWKLKTRQYPLASRFSALIWLQYNGKRAEKRKSFILVYVIRLRLDSPTVEYNRTESGIIGKLLSTFSFIVKYSVNCDPKFIDTPSTVTSFKLNCLSFFLTTTLLECLLGVVACFQTEENFKVISNCYRLCVNN